MQTESDERNALSQDDLARSSWENPFRPRLWSCDGWRIDEDSMVSDFEEVSLATFRRPYRNVVIECRLTQSEQSAKDSPAESPQCFELRLLEKSTGNWIGLKTTAESVLLSHFASDQRPALQLLRESPPEPPSDDNHEMTVRFSMTPNRILIAINGRLRINASRPASLMHRDCLPQFVVHQPGVRLSDLRIEGD
ncbi:MAG: hypothetical protein O3B13_14610 [Planctomycetota bacterium]|nr:hypothetical protein [Planctomycetota bacterium]